MTNLARTFITRGSKSKKAGPVKQVSGVYINKFQVSIWKIDSPNIILNDIATNIEQISREKYDSTSSFCKIIVISLITSYVLNVSKPLFTHYTFHDSLFLIPDQKIRIQIYQIISLQLIEGNFSACNTVDLQL